MVFPEIKRAKYCEIYFNDNYSPRGVDADSRELVNVEHESDCEFYRNSKGFCNCEARYKLFEARVREERLCRAAWARALAENLMCGWVRGISGNPRGCSLGCACANCKAYAALLLQAEQDEKEAV